MSTVSLPSLRRRRYRSRRRTFTCASIGRGGLFGSASRSTAVSPPAARVSTAPATATLDVAGQGPPAPKALRRLHLLQKAEVIGVAPVLGTATRSCPLPRGHLRSIHRPSSGCRRVGRQAVAGQGRKAEVPAGRPYRRVFVGRVFVVSALGRVFGNRKPIFRADFKTAFTSAFGFSFRRVGASTTPL